MSSIRICTGVHRAGSFSIAMIYVCFTHTRERLCLLPDAFLQLHGVGVLRDVFPSSFESCIKIPLLLQKL